MDIFWNTLLRKSEISFFFFGSNLYILLYSYTQLCFCYILLTWGISKTSTLDKSWNSTSYKLFKYCLYKVFGMGGEVDKGLFTKWKSDAANLWLPEDTGEKDTLGDWHWHVHTTIHKTDKSRKWQPTPVFLPGESHGQRRLAGYSPWVCR